MSKVKINGKEYTLIRIVYDAFNECFFYYTKECDEPFCSLCETIEGIEYD